MHGAQHTGLDGEALPPQLQQFHLIARKNQEQYLNEMADGKSNGDVKLEAVTVKKPKN